MAQVGVQQPTNLMEMFSSPSMMLGDIAAQQVNDQTLGNLVNRQQAQQDLDIQRQKLPFELQQLGLQNQEIGARIPGVQADSGLKQNNLRVSNATIDQQTKAKISELAKTVSDNDLAQAENGVKQLMVHPDPKIRASAKPLFDSLYEIRKERDKLSIQGGNAIALERERGTQQRKLEDQQYQHGKYLKPGTMSLGLRFNTLTDPIQIDTVARQLLADENLPDDVKQAVIARAKANVPAYNKAMEAKINAKGAPDVSAVGGLPAVQAPTAGPFPGEDNTPTPQLQLGPKDTQALQWARANPNDPRSKAILQKLGIKQ